MNDSILRHHQAKNCGRRGSTHSSQYDMEGGRRGRGSRNDLKQALKMCGQAICLSFTTPAPRPHWNEFIAQVWLSSPRRMICKSPSKVRGWGTMSQVGLRHESKHVPRKDSNSNVFVSLGSVDQFHRGREGQLIFEQSDEQTNLHKQRRR